MPSGLIDQNTYYPSNNIVVFPSSNAVDSGKLFTELNGRNITINITDLNYVVSPNPEGYAISFNSETQQIDIQPGKCIINGFEADTNSVISYRLPTADEIVADASQIDDNYNGFALLCLQTLFDAQNNLCGNVQVGATWYCTGIRVVYASLEEYTTNPNEYLLLGGVKEDGTVIGNKDRFQRIDAKYILVKIEEDPETGTPPTQTTDLLTFINNFLKGYWVSKIGDNEYGDLLFKTQPANYLEEGFDYTTEDPLNSNKFAIKLSKTTDTSPKGKITLQSETSTKVTNLMSSELLPESIRFYGENYLDDSSIATSGIFADNFSLDKTIYSTGSSLSIYSQDLIKLSTPNDNVALFVENNIKAHGNVKQGNVIYAKSSFNDNTNYLVDNIGNISTVYNENQYITLESGTSKIYINSEPNTGEPGILLQAGSLLGDIKLLNYSFEKGENNSSFSNVVSVRDNLKISSNSDDKGNLQAEGFIVAGKIDGNNPASIIVPDMYNGGERTLKSGDIYGTQIWSAVYNDLAEIFDVSDNLVGEEIVKLLLAVDEENPTKYVLADKQHKCVVGVVSENPAFCAGGKDCKNGVPVALAGRVEVKYEGKTPKIGDFVKVSNKTPGYATKCKYNSKYRCGKIIDIIDESTVKIIVLL